MTKAKWVAVLTGAALFLTACTAFATIAYPLLVRGPKCESGCTCPQQKELKSGTRAAGIEGLPTIKLEGAFRAGGER
jgi:hypothetical protein